MKVTENSEARRLVATSGKSARSTIPTQSTGPVNVSAADRWATVRELAALAVDYIRDGVAGPDAQRAIGTRDTIPVDALTLLRELGDSDLSDGARLARMLDAITANLAAVNR
jgi:hypothetical protein